MISGTRRKVAEQSEYRAQEGEMSFSPTPEQQEIRAAVTRLCERFGDEYWLKKDDEGGFPHEFHRAMAEAGGLGLAMPEGYGGGGVRVTKGPIPVEGGGGGGGGGAGGPPPPPATFV